jgi:hypothetical protein
MMRSLYGVLLFLAIAPVLPALTPEQVDMLEDGGGWEYLTITDANNGFETQHVCFDEKGRGQCTGKLLLRKDGTFLQTVTGHGKSMDRHGTFAIDGDAITFADEFGTKDGPYTARIDVPSSRLEIATTQAGVTIKVRLMLEREFRKLAEQAGKQKPQ